MSKVKQKPKYFDIQDVISEYPDTTAYVVVGQRGVSVNHIV